jgi:hypothetical protein
MNPEIRAVLSGLMIAALSYGDLKELVMVAHRQGVFIPI